MENKIDILIKSVNEFHVSNNKVVASINYLSDKLTARTSKMHEHTKKLNTIISTRLFKNNKN